MDHLPPPSWDVRTSASASGHAGEPAQNDERTRRSSGGFAFWLFSASLVMWIALSHGGHDWQALVVFATWFASLLVQRVELGGTLGRGWRRGRAPAASTSDSDPERSW